MTRAALASRVPYRGVDLREGDPHLADSSDGSRSSVGLRLAAAPVSARVSTFSRTTGSVLDMRTLKRHARILDAQAVGLVHGQRAGRVALPDRLQRPRPGSASVQVDLPAHREAARCAPPPSPRAAARPR